MRTRRALVAFALAGCAADGVTELGGDASMVVVDAPPIAPDRTTPFVDSGLDARATDVADAQRVDAPPTDLASPDRPVIVDTPAIVDMPGPTCTLPPPAARPPSAGPDGQQVPRDVATEHPDWIANSCVSMGGNTRFLTEVLRRLRARDPRWGLDRVTGGISSDVVTYFYGDGCPEGRREAYMFDVVLRHCGTPGRDAPPAPGWIDRAPEMPVWTLDGFDGTPFDAGAPDVPATPDVPPSRPPLPDGSGVVRAVASERADLLRASCATMGGNNEFLFEVVRRLRRIDARWGLNWKRGVVGDMSQDVVDYYAGPSGGAMEGSTDTYIVDIIGGHCGTTPTAAWTDVTEATRMGGTIGRWTLAGRTDLGP